MKVRILATPDIAEMDGIHLCDMRPGTVREVSPSIGAWLIAEGFAVPEMRSQREQMEPDPCATANDSRPQRRKTD